MDDIVFPSLATHDISVIHQSFQYADDFAQAGQAANAAASLAVFDTYHRELASNSRKTYHFGLALFSRFLSEAGVSRSVEQLMSDPHAWIGMSYGVALAFQRWLLHAGYSTKTVRDRLDLLHVYARLCGPAPDGAGLLSAQEVAAIAMVRGATGKAARNIDADRVASGLSVRRGRKKAMHTQLSAQDVIALRKTSAPGRRRRDDQPDRDALLVALLGEHGFRVSEVAALTVESFDLRAGTITVYRQKTDRRDTLRLGRFTRQIAEPYLSALGRSTGPLFVGYKGARMAIRSIEYRIARLGEEISVLRLSPHDLRHDGAYRAFRSGESLEHIMRWFGWSSPAMALRYAERTGIVETIRMDLED